MIERIWENRGIGRKNCKNECVKKRNREDQEYGGKGLRKIRDIGKEI